MVKETARQRMRRERKAFRGIVRKRTAAVMRQSYEREALKVAEEKGQALARKKSFREMVAERVREGAERRVRGLPARTVQRTPVRRTTRRRVYRTPVRRAPVRRRTYRRAAPVRRTYRAPIRRAPVRRVVVQQPVQQRSVIEDLI